jgi:hypothetical protein
VHKE